MTRPLMTDGSDKLRSMRQKAKVPTPPPVEDKTAPKPKAPKTLADHQAKLQLRCEQALEAAVAADATGTEELLELAGRKILSFLGCRKWILDNWTPEGSLIIHPPKEGYRGWYVTRIIPGDPGFCAQIWHREPDPNDPEKKLEVIDHCTTSYSTADAAKEAAYEHAQDIGIHHRLIRVWKTWYEGERDFEADRGGLNNSRNATLSCLHRFVLEHSKADTTDELVDAELVACGKPLQQYNSCLDLFNSRWDTSGNWIGPTKPTPKAKGKKATKPVAHYLANFQKVIERNNFEEADNRILHAFRNNFPVDDLKRYEEIARPFQDKLSNYEQLRTKADLIPATE